ncbi:MAG: hypothetical protein JSS27_06155 [Planctomycetes bacterium]|nr:hypothetical protein [Planctomycetota bacterium]
MHRIVTALLIAALPGLLMPPGACSCRLLGFESVCCRAGQTSAEASPQTPAGSCCCHAKPSSASPAPVVTNCCAVQNGTGCECGCSREAPRLESKQRFAPAIAVSPLFYTAGVPMTVGTHPVVVPFTDLPAPDLGPLLCRWRC